MSGLMPSYPPVFALLLTAGVGIAMFHPPAGRDARRKGARRPFVAKPAPSGPL
ncbi:hypothetical protein ABZ554_08590 [Streptomyces sp. NPDC020125]|uniref:hypothetical protein n=1 Tax=Streptomyces sp. NPDC020125 TaxID=3154593 RepID=UPI0033C433EC